MLLANGYNLDDYTDEIINAFIEEAKQLIGAEFLAEKEITDYKRDFNNNVYVTKFYPVNTTENINITINQEPATVEHSTPGGIIYLDKNYHGTLICTYTTGLNETELLNEIAPIILILIEANAGKNLASISEGDVNISYDNTAQQNIYNLIENIKNKYSARAELII